MNTTDARLGLDPALTKIALGYENPEFVGMELFPFVPVSARGGKVIEFNKDNFKTVATARTPGSNTSRITVGYGKQDFALIDHSLDAVVPKELVEESKVPGIDLKEPAVNDVKEIVDRGLEVEQATLATTSGNYPTGHHVALASGSRFNDSATDPLPVVETGKNKIRSATGRLPNKMLISYDVFSALRMNPQVQASVKYTGSGAPTPAKITPDMLAAYFGVDKVVIGKSVTEGTTADSITDVWSKVIVLAWVNSQAKSSRTPNFGYTYRLKGYPYVEAAYYDKSIKSWINGYTDSRTPKITMSNAGYLLTTVID